VGSFKGLAFSISDSRIAGGGEGCAAIEKLYMIERYWVASCSSASLWGLRSLMSKGTRSNIECNRHSSVLTSNKMWCLESCLSHCLLY
jgi:hypothetical protein